MAKGKEAAIKDLMRIPGVGVKTAEVLLEMGYRSMEDLKGQDPERLYLRLSALKGTHIDRCMLYVFRCAVYFASKESHDKRLLKWWNRKDEKRTGR